MLKRTPLFDAHVKLGGRMVEFGGWEMPVQYTSIVDEHNAVRNAAGIFDISHMGEALVTGDGAALFLNRTLTNDINKLPVGMGQYTLMCNAEGGVIDDLYVYRLAETEFLLVINASRIDADVLWLEESLAGCECNQSTTVRNISDSHGAVAVQGPKVAAFIDQCFEAAPGAAKPSALKKNQLTHAVYNDVTLWIGRTGYTGEDGFEVIAPAHQIEAVWNRVLEVGRPHGLKPAGLGARDTLRTEVCYPLYGHELGEDITPIEAGLARFVSLEKGEFTGRAVLERQKADGVKKTLVAFKMAEKSAPPRPGYAIWSADGATRLGDVVSGTQSVSLGQGIGLGFVPPGNDPVGTKLQIEIRGKKTPAEVVARPFFKKPKA